MLAQCTQHGPDSLAIVIDDDGDLETGIDARTATFLPNQSYTQTVTAGVPGAIDTAAGGTDEFFGKTQTPILQFKLPWGTYERYLGVIATIGGAAALTAGGVHAQLVQHVNNFRHYPNAI